MLEKILDSLKFKFLDGSADMIEYNVLPERYIWRKLPYWVIGCERSNTPDSFFVEMPPHGKFTLNDNTLLVIPPNQIHQFTATVGHKNISTWFHGKYMFDFGIDISEFIEIPFIFTAPISLKIKALIEELLKVYANKSIPALSKKVAQSRLGFEILHIMMPFAKEHRIDELSHSDAGRIFHILEYIDKNYVQNLDVKFLARLLHLSPTHFNKLFRKILNQSPMEFVRKIRMSKACDLLTSTTLPISKIALTVGYEDQYIFSRSFKNAMGVSPMNYRKHMDQFAHNTSLVSLS